MTKEEAPLLQWECVLHSDEQIALLHQWRNDPSVRRASFHTQTQSFEQYKRSFCLRYARNSSLPPLFALYRQERVAALLFEPFDDPQEPLSSSCSISIMVSEARRNQGLGKAALAQIMPWLADRSIESVFAEVRVDNPASARLFEKAGFFLRCTTEKEVEGVSVAYHLYQYRLQAPLPWRGVYVIAEAGSNWRSGSDSRDLSMGRALIEAAAESGANAVKFQTYRPATVYAPKAGSASYLDDRFGKQSIEAIFADLAMPYELLPKLAQYAKECSIDFMSTPFSLEDLDQVDPFVSYHKIASYEISHLRLLEAAASKGKPLFLSTGAASLDEIAWAVDLLRQKGQDQLILMQCTACYPTPPCDVHIRTLPYLKEKLLCNVGLSDHSADHLVAPVMAVAAGAVAIEKHFTLSRRLPGPDHFFAITPEELKAMVEAVRKAELMRGLSVKAVSFSEESLRRFARRGLQALRFIAKGEPLIENQNVAILRPGNRTVGEHPCFLPKMQGRRFLQDIEEGEGILWGHLE